MIQISVTADIRRAQQYMKRVEKGIRDKAVPRALNRTATAVRTQAVRDMQQERAVKVRVIRSAMSIKRATRTNQTATVTVSGKPIPIREFIRNLRAKRGLQARIKKGGKRTLLKRHGNRAFSNPRLAGGNVFVRTSGKRLPIQKWPPVPGLPRVFVQKRILSSMRRVVAKVFPARVVHEINHEIRRARS